jgi:hypothetical protein
MKKLLIVLAALTLTACGKMNHAEAVWTGNSTSCVDGVQYIQFPSGVTVKYTRDGKIAGC